MGAPDAVEPMNPFLSISMQAADDGDLIQTIVIMVVVGLGALGSFLKKRSEENEQEKSARASRRHAKRMAKKKREDEGGWREISRDRPSPVPVPPPKPVVQEQDLLEQLQEPDSLSSIQPLQSAPIPVPVPPVRPQRVARRASKRIPLGTISQQSTAAPLPTPETSAVHIHVSLTRKSARNAIIFHEILSTPKALRDEREMWE